ncbi:hypothetical protein [Falsiphaeobacter marinintestinus]|uniref:hypothetical protein n=1 Tax=Falsiphaeobacter marinintestinus TaxID=1492905 RepID=UPI0011B6FAFF|nr:hypothetical protein [Phaeobacter marinintestinus]
MAEAFFSNKGTLVKSLYLASTAPPNGGAVAFVLGNKDIAPPSDDISLSQALNDDSLLGQFVFAPTALGFDSSESPEKLQQDFVDAIWVQAGNNPGRRGVYWIPLPASFTGSSTVPFLGLSDDGSTVSAGMNDANVLPSMQLSVLAGTQIELDGTTLNLIGQPVSFTGSSAPEMQPPVFGTLPFYGPSRGCVVFKPFIQRLSLQSDWNWGFQFLFAEQDDPNTKQSEWLPFGSVTEGANDMIGFVAAIDPANPLNTLETLNVTPGTNRSGLVFTGKNIDNQKTSVLSQFRTVMGQQATLWPVPEGTTGDDVQPAGFAFALGKTMQAGKWDFHASPFGDFLIDVDPGPTGKTADMLCGLAGAEFVTITPGTDLDSGSRVRFLTQHPAFAPIFPPPVSSPTGPPSNSAALLTDTYLTSWAVFLAPGTKTNTYAAQPNGAALYGYDPYVWEKHHSMLGHVDPGATLPQGGTDAFPMVPYSGFQLDAGANSFSQDQSRRFEERIIGPTRRAKIGDRSEFSVLSVRAEVSGDSDHLQRLSLSSDETNKSNFATPAGLIASVDTTDGPAAWSNILLGQIKQPVETKLQFAKPSALLQQAFNTNQLFMVAANAENFVRTDGVFDNIMNIGGWSIQADVGQSLAYGDYTNIMIVKGVPGPLFDPDGDPKENLVANPDKWTQADKFASPTFQDSDAAPDPNQMVNLSKWLQEYFEDALNQDPEFFSAFNTIARSHDWTGIIILRAKIAAPPADLAGITAGVRDPEKFYAHHLAVEISQIKSDPDGSGISIGDQSSVYGLIYYVDDQYDTFEPGSPVVPQYGADYDFITLTLKVLFENTSVKSFSSYTQLALNTIFGSPVTGMAEGGNQYNSIVMAGTFQDNNNKPTYGMKTVQDYRFKFGNNVLSEVEVVSAEMNTVSTEMQGDTVVRFGLTGFMDFHVLESAGDVDGPPIDLYSFGRVAGQESQNRIGLNYGNLGLNMTFATQNPAKTRKILFDSSAISFNIPASTIRPGSLFDALSLDLQALISSDSSTVTPKSLGYLDIVTNVRQNGVSDTWNGLKFKLNLGTVGDLGGKVGLNAYLLLAWSPDSIRRYRSVTGLHMPGTSNGAPLISLQNVLSLSYGTIQLLYSDKPGAEVLHPTTLRPLHGAAIAATKDGDPGKQFMLVMNEIAIKFLGMLKIPPNGSTAFYLFGDADGADASKNTGLAWYAAYNKKKS